MNNSFYAYTDLEIRYINKQITRVFRKKLKIDELNVIESSKKMYDELLSTAIGAYLRIAKKKYPRATKKWLMAILTDYDRVTGYVFTHEMERKRARFAEGTIAGTEDGTAKRLMALMLSQYAITVTDYAVLAALTDEGFTKVRWVSTEDERRCKVCKERHGKVYNINRVPPKPHLNCRCYFVPVK